MGTVGSSGSLNPNGLDCLPTPPRHLPPGTAHRRTQGALNFFSSRPEEVSTAHLFWPSHGKERFLVIHRDKSLQYRRSLRPDGCN